MIYNDNNKEFRFFVKITFYERYAALSKCHYFRNDMKMDFYQRWFWYFKYREALLRVKNPKLNIKFECGSYEYVLPEEEYRIKVKNKYLSAKRQITRFENKLKQILKNWDELFPIEEHHGYKKIIEKRDY